MSDTQNTPEVVVLGSEWYNAVYRNGVRTDEGKPEYLDDETVVRVTPGAAHYWVPDDVYDDVLNGAGYPEKLSDFPLDRCERRQ